MRRGCLVGGGLVGGYVRGVRGGLARGDCVRGCLARGNCVRVGYARDNHARGSYVRGGRARASGRTVGIAAELLVGLLGHVYPHPSAYVGQRIHARASSAARF